MIAEADGSRGAVAVMVRALALGLPLPGRALTRLGRSGLAGSLFARLRSWPRPRWTGLPLGTALAHLSGLARLGRLGVLHARLLGMPVSIVSLGACAFRARMHSIAARTAARPAATTSLAIAEAGSAVRYARRGRDLVRAGRRPGPRRSADRRSR